ncbi:Bicarbonate transport ATP-binding protein CmpD [Streptomyces sp. RB5]|uniref:Bicarbonate transport ATP-binding protein CmpD n=1 Tax=Streptomyces smaragdinus TaxID=2585196 RepID=A0A7K0CA55_9ACTN|nr:ABC transporter ATP-binding protein [Streptomyces smaragdinus]MQY10273.1 Bicarbonate transport ATP-binding protein CmpD [Streptomyces smaragdinus]
MTAADGGRGVAADPRTAALTFAGVGLRYPGGTRALDGIDLSVAPGEFVSVVGPSGCGKSSLLRIAAGLQAPTAGTVTGRGESVGYVFQDATLLPWRSVRANVELFGELRGLGREERRKRAAEALDLVGLADVAGHRPRTLSGGMRMRVSLARSLTLRPGLFLLDEPFGTLDEITRERLDDDLLALFAARRFAALFVTHSVLEAVYLSSRVVVLSPGPGRVVGEFDVPFDYPRPAGLRFDPEAARLAALVSACMRGAAAP